MKNNLYLIKESLINNFSSELLDKAKLTENTKKINEFNNILSSSSLLLKLYQLHENLYTKNVSSKNEAKDYLNENLNFLNKVTTKDLEKELSKFDNFEYKENINESERELHESIHVLIVESTKDVLKQNSDLLFESKNKVKEHLLKEKTSNTILEESVNNVNDNDDFLRYLAEDFNKDIEGLGEVEKQVITEAMSKNDKENESWFNSEKNSLIENLEIISNFIDEETKKELNESINKYALYEFEANKFLSKILEMKELKKQLKEKTNE